MKQMIFTEKATKPTAPYSQAVKTGNIGNPYRYLGLRRKDV